MSLLLRVNALRHCFHAAGPIARCSTSSGVRASGSISRLPAHTRASSTSTAPLEVPTPIASNWLGYMMAAAGAAGLLFIANEVANDSPSNPQEKVIWDQVQEADKLVKAGKLAEAEVLFRKALAGAKQHMSWNPIAISDIQLYLVAEVLLPFQKHTEAEAILLETVDILTKAQKGERHALVKSDPIKAKTLEAHMAERLIQNLASAHYDLMHVYRETGDPSKAEAQGLLTIEAQSKVPDLKPALKEIRNAHVLQEIYSLQLPNSEKYLHQAYNILSKIKDPEYQLSRDRHLCNVTDMLAEISMGQQKWKEAENYLKKHGEYMESLKKGTKDKVFIEKLDQHYAYVLRNYGVVYANTNRFADARRVWEKAEKLTTNQNLKDQLFLFIMDLDRAEEDQKAKR